MLMYSRPLQACIEHSNLFKVNEPGLHPKGPPYPVAKEKKEKKKEKRIPPFSILFSFETENMENQFERNPKILGMSRGMRNDPHSVKSRSESLIKENRQTQYSPQKKGKTGSPNSEIQLRAF